MNRNDSQFHAEIAALTQDQAKFVAIKHYRSETGKSLRRSRKDVEMILWRKGIRSETPPRFQFPHYINWNRVAILGIPALLGLLIAWALVVLLFPE